MIKGVQAHANSTVTPAMQCLFCKKSVKSRHGLRTHLNFCNSNGAHKKRKHQNGQPPKPAKSTKSTKPEKPANPAIPPASVLISWASGSCKLLSGSIKNFDLPDEEEFDKLKRIKCVT